MLNKMLKRFWAKVKQGPGCWEWQAVCFPDGYGAFRLKGSMQGAHRVSYAMGHDIPKGMCVLHTCDNRLCVRPSHLFLGTKADNMADRDAKGRQARGVHNGKAKLTEAQVRSIRSDLRSLRVIAEDYEVFHTTIGCIKRRETWKHVN
ncbi:hypothetical protein LCGC14_0209420 [marine sediment metagenome]|uniref:HNH nuclease domain-containing protein n=1 Tax=marine sediment metagenome TaxID=412755 RepID=A0A0F9X116_9ZZZZ